MKLLTMKRIVFTVFRVGEG